MNKTSKNQTFIISLLLLDSKKNIDHIIKYCIAFEKLLNPYNIFELNQS